MDYKQYLTKKTAAISAATVTCIMLVLYFAGAFSSSPAKVVVLQSQTVASSAAAIVNDEALKSQPDTSSAAAIVNDAKPDSVIISNPVPMSSSQTAEPIPDLVRRLRAQSPDDFANLSAREIDITEEDVKRFNDNLRYTDEKIAELAEHLPSMVSVLVDTLAENPLKNKDDLRLCLRKAHEKFIKLSNELEEGFPDWPVEAISKLKTPENKQALIRAIDEIFIAREKKVHYISTARYVSDAPESEIEAIVAKALAGPSVPAETVASIVPFQEMEYIKKHGFGDDFSDLKKRGLTFGPYNLSLFGNLDKWTLAGYEDILKIAGDSPYAALLIATHISDNGGVKAADALTKCLHKAYNAFWKTLGNWFEDGMKELKKANPSLMLASNVAQLRQAISDYLEARDRSETNYESSNLPGSLYTRIYNRKPSQKQVKVIAKNALAVKNMKQPAPNK